MKAVLGVAAVLTWFGRCQGLEFPYTGPEPGEVASRDAAVDVALDPDASGALDASRPDSSDAAVDVREPCVGPPGLYVPGSCTTLAPGLRAYRTAYELWSDGADKERFIYLPPGTQIDTIDPDRWAFPEGTRIYKTFGLDGLRIETRVLEKVAAPAVIESWTLVAYAWSPDQRSVSLADPAGVLDALGTTHDIPAQVQCRSCHQMPNHDVINGFGAIQLNYAAAGFTLHELIIKDLLVNSGGDPNVSLQAARLPGDAVDQAALGYLHANCGNCHGGPNPRAGFVLASLIGITRVAATPAYLAAVCQCLTRWTGRDNAAGGVFTRRIVAGDAADSGVIGRMSLRVTGEQMPPIGSARIDTAGLAAVSAWIDRLDPTLCAAAPACAAPVSM